MCLCLRVGICRCVRVPGGDQRRVLSILEFQRLEAAWQGCEECSKGPLQEQPLNSLSRSPPPLPPSSHVYLVYGWIGVGTCQGTCMWGQRCVGVWSTCQDTHMRAEMCGYMGAHVRAHTWGQRRVGVWGYLSGLMRGQRTSFRTWLFHLYPLSPPPFFCYFPSFLFFFSLPSFPFSFSDIYDLEPKKWMWNLFWVRVGFVCCFKIYSHVAQAGLPNFLWTWGWLWTPLILLPQPPCLVNSSIPCHAQLHLELKLKRYKIEWKNNSFSLRRLSFSWEDLRMYRRPTGEKGKNAFKGCDLHTECQELGMGGRGCLKRDTKGCVSLI